MLSIYCTTSLIFISNFRLLVLQFYHIFDFFLVPLHFNIIFPEACTSILLLLVCSLVPEVCGVYSIIAVCCLEHTILYGHCFHFHYCQIYNLKYRRKKICAFITVVSSYT